MESINPAALLTPPGPAPTRASLPEMSTQDFLKLLVTQLTHQDPLEPMGNEELLRQIASIREIELSTTLTDSLQTLTGQQHFASASSLIGQYVTGLPGPDGATQRGLVVGIRFAPQGQTVLLLSNGAELSLSQVGTIESPLRAGEALIGQKVAGVDRRDSSQPEAVEGVVTASRLDDAGQVLLELDSGHDLRLIDVLGVEEVAND